MPTSDMETIEINSKRKRLIVICGKKRRITTLAKFIYEQEYGRIPKGYEVHHKDFNRNNNDISNLIAISKEEHQKIHDCVERVKNKPQKILSPAEIESIGRYQELFNFGFRAIKIINHSKNRFLIMRDTIGNTFEIIKPKSIDVQIEKVEVKKYSFEELIKMGYKIIKEAGNEFATFYVLKSPYGNNININKSNVLAKYLTNSQK